LEARLVVINAAEEMDPTLVSKVLQTVRAKGDTPPRTPHDNAATGEGVPLPTGEADCNRGSIGWALEVAWRCVLRASYRRDETDEREKGDLARHH
jgi:hypothetical protein